MKNGAERWFPITTVMLLCAQLALLWLQGSLLNRQYADIKILKNEVRELAAILNETLTIEGNGYAAPVFALESRSKPPGMKLAAMQQDDDLAIRIELEKSSEPARDAVRQTREAHDQRQLSEKEGQPWLRRVNIGIVILAALLGAVAGAWLRRN